MDANSNRAHMDGARFGLKQVWLDEAGDKPFRLDVALEDSKGMHVGYGPDMRRQFTKTADGRIVGVDNNYRGWSIGVPRVWVAS